MPGMTCPRHLFSVKRAPPSGIRLVSEAAAAGGASSCWRGLSRVCTGPLRQQDEATKNKGRDHRRGEWTTQGEPAVVYRLVQEVANRSAERSGQDERRPEQQNPRHPGPVIGCSEHRQPGGKDERPSFVSETRRVGHPIAEGSSQCL